MADEFFEALRAVYTQARRIEPVDDEVLLRFMRVGETLALADTAEFETRGPTYYVKFPGDDPETRIIAEEWVVS